MPFAHEEFMTVLFSPSIRTNEKHHDSRMKRIVAKRGLEQAGQ